MKSKTKLEYNPKDILIGLYWHPEYYPPTLNCINSLLQSGYNITIVCLNLFENKDIERATGVKMVKCGVYKTISQYNSLSTFKKLTLWIQFSLKLLINIKQKKIILLYDPIPLLSYGIIYKIFKSNKIIWYHNHDILLSNLQRRFSISWFASKFEYISFKHIDIFSLPSEERKKYFPISYLKGKYFFLPNYPALKNIKSRNQSKDSDFIKIIFQGSISPSNGIENIINIIPFYYQGKPLKIILKGYISQKYHEELFKHLKEKNCLKFIDYFPPSSYAEVFPLTASSDIGWAVFKSNDIMALTLGTASNKIYEYASAGLPVIYADYPHFKSHLNKFKWAISSDLTPEDLKLKITCILDNYKNYSNAAIDDINNNINFDEYIKPIVDHLDEIAFP